MQKNVASQKFVVFAFDRTDNTAKTGDAANITANIRLDHAGASATNDVNPTETEDGFYVFDATQAETNADTIQVFPASSTSNIQVIAVPGVIYTVPVSFADEAAATAAALTTAQDDLDIITDSDGVIIGAAAVDLVWDESLSMHNTGGTTGKALKNAAAFIITDGTAQAGAAGQITLASGESATDNIFNHDVIIITGGTGQGEARIIFRYTGSTKVALISPNWDIEPDNTSTYEILPGITHTASAADTLHEGYAQAGGASTITLASYASAINDFYTFQQVIAHSGTGAGQVRVITAYNGTTKVVTTNRAWDTNPDTTTHYLIQADAHAPFIADVVLDELLSEHTTAGSLGKAIADNETNITNIQSRVPASLINGRMNSDVEAINDSTAPAVRLSTWLLGGHHGTAQAGAAGSITLTAGADSNDGFYNGCMVVIGNGAGKKQRRRISDYNGTTKVAIVAGNWIVNPDSSSEYVVIPLGLIDTQAEDALTDYDGPTNAEFEVRTPTAAQLAYIVANAATGVPVTFTTSGGSTTAAVLNQVDGSGASATNDQYKSRLLVFNIGTLKEVVTDITGYNGTTKVATITAIPFAPTSSHTARLI